MSYQYRWFYAVLYAFLIVAAGYFFDLRALFDEHEKAAIAAKQTALKIAAARKKPAMPLQDYGVQNEARSFSSLSRLLNFHHLELMSASRTGEPQDDAGDHVIVRGDYFALRQFIAVAAACGSDCDMGDIVLTPDASQMVRAELNMRLRSRDHQFNLSASAAPEKIINPFCGVPLTQQTVVMSQALFPMDVMHFLGTVVRDEVRRALVLLPDGEMNEVAAGEILGREGGRVEKIDESKLTLVLPDHSRREMR